jgi:hypothetical protein
VLALAVEWTTALTLVGVDTQSPGVLWTLAAVLSVLVLHYLGASLATRVRLYLVCVPATLSHPLSPSMFIYHTHSAHFPLHTMLLLRKRPGG